MSLKRKLLNKTLGRYPISEAGEVVGYSQAVPSVRLRELKPPNTGAHGARPYRGMLEAANVRGFTTFLRFLFGFAFVNSE